MENLTKKELKKKEFLGCCLEEFVAKGIYEASVKDIAKRANITERTAFRYYNTKQEMVLESVRLLWENYMNRVFTDYSSLIKPGSTRENIKAILMLYSKIFLTDKQRLLFVAEAEAYLTRCGVSIYTAEGFPLKINPASPLASIINKGINNGEINKANVMDLYYSSFDTLLGFMEKLAIEYYNGRITDEDAIRRLDILCDILSNAYFN